MISNQQYRNYLKSIRKPRTGDRLLESTIETYVRYMEPYLRKGMFNVKKKSELIVIMNKELARRKDHLLKSAFLHYLGKVGFTDSQKKLLVFKAVPRATALTSQRKMQEELLSEEEINRLLETKDLMMRCIFRWLYDTGCRRDELLSIKLKNIKVKVSDDDKKAGLFGEITVMGKGRKQRQVFIGKEAKYDALRLVKERGLKRDDFLFRFYKDKDRKKLYKDQAFTLWYNTKKIGEDLLDKHIHPHMFRHSRATHMANKGAREIDIANYLGHADTATVKVYLHLGSYNRRQAFKKYT